MGSEQSVGSDSRVWIKGNIANFGSVGSAECVGSVGWVERVGCDKCF